MSTAELEHSRKGGSQLVGRGNNQIDKMHPMDRRPPPLSIKDPNLVKVLTETIEDDLSQYIDAGPHTPVVVLLGWINCSMKHLNSYVDNVWTPLGFSSLALKVPDLNQ